MGKRPFLVSVAILFALLLVVWLTALIPFDAPAGHGDFQAYWSAGYLLARSQNFADADLLWQVEREQTGWSRDYLMQTWNPPWLLALLVPYTLVSFRQATWLWLFTNLGLIFTASVWIWQVSAKQALWARRSWIAPLLAFAFLPTLIGLLAGQVNTLVYFGLAAFLYFSERERPFAAGAGLALTLVKPHLVYITLPIMLLAALTRREWRVWLGLGSVIAALTGIAFALRPTFLLDYGRSALSGNLLSWQTPTLGGILAVSFGWQWSKLMGILVLPVATAVWWRWRDRVNQSQLLGITVLISIITAPFGWGYDAIILLLPMLQIIVWVVEGHYGRVESILFLFSLVLINALSFYQRMLGTNEVYYFWIPLAAAALYSGAGWRQRQLGSARFG